MEKLKSIVIEEFSNSHDFKMINTCDIMTSSSDDEYINKVKEYRKKRNCRKNYCEMVVPTYTNEEFLSHFRIGRNLFEQLLTKFKKSEVFLNLENHSKVVSPEKHVLMFLWYAGHEACSFRDIGDRFDLSISTVHDIITRMIFFFSNMAESIITWPNDDEKVSNEQHFKEKGFPGVIGAIDGTHVQIDPPENCSDDYINRKGFHSIILQGICNYENQFIDIFVGFPGAAHDSRVFKSSPIFSKLPNISFYLLGDSAYPCLKWCITPYRDNGHLNAAQKNFNVKLSGSRVCIEHTFGILKQRFRQLYYLKLNGQERICHFVRACCVLHNLCGVDDVLNEEENFNLSAICNSDYSEISDKRGQELRNELCRQLYVQY